MAWSVVYRGGSYPKILALRETEEVWDEGIYSTYEEAFEAAKIMAWIHDGIPMTERRYYDYDKKVLYDNSEYIKAVRDYAQKKKIDGLMLGGNNERYNQKA